MLNLLAVEHSGRSTYIMLLSTYLFAILDQLRITLFVMRRSFMLWVNNANTGYSDYFFYTDH